MSLAQVKKTKASLQKVEKNLPKDTETSFIKALVDLASNEFADGAMIQKVSAMLNDIRQNLSDGLNEAIKQEEDRQNEYDDEMAAKHSENDGFESDIIITTG